eukprot:COSAG01_NODE_13647_length_1553_cov_8.526135_1_plen_254_part_10
MFVGRRPCRCACSRGLSPPDAGRPSHSQGHLAEGGREQVRYRVPHDDAMIEAPPACLPPSLPPSLPACLSVCLSVCLRRQHSRRAKAADLLPCLCRCAGDQFRALTEISERSRSPALLWPTRRVSPGPPPAQLRASVSGCRPLDAGRADQACERGGASCPWHRNGRGRISSFECISCGSDFSEGRGLRHRVARLGSVAGRGCYRLRHAAYSRHVATGSITASSRHGAMASGELCACVCVCVGKNTFHSAPTQPP